ncbi:Ig-like domain-containing protein [Flagellimonas meishanensis]|uniref:Ig-like domain-containing protein n=1 Tax=Flagellimonas meishanensis TaxID=2873264 RepID=UPI001CA669A5|nr:Ig-like domain-containing protein [[Muricauda] meishanensis]
MDNILGIVPILGQCVNSKKVFINSSDQILGNYPFFHLKIEKIMKKPLCLLAVLLFFGLFSISCSNEDPVTPSKPVTKGTLSLNRFTSTPQAGPVGTKVIITGQNFSSTIEDNIVKIGDTEIPVTSASSTVLRCIVPEGASTGELSVTVNGNTATGNIFTITEPTAVTLDKIQLTLYPYPLYAETLMVTSDLEGSSVVWSSSDETVATVDQNGLVTPLTIGNAIITAEVANGSAQSIVMVIDGPVTKLELDPTQLELYSGESESISIATLEADVAQVSDPIWNSDNETVATVDQDGNVTAVAAGTATITVTVDNASANCIVTVNPNVYVAGYKTLNGTDVARIWKNGNATDLTDGFNNARAHSVYIHNEDIYVAGYENVNGIDVAIIWKNGTPIQLSNGVNNAHANSVVVDDNGISYVVGYLTNGGTESAVLWRNQVANQLPSSGLGDARANSVFVEENGTVHIAGYEIINNNTIARIWEDGTPTNLTMVGSNGNANSVFVRSGNVYVAGFYYDPNASNNVAKLWENSVATDLSDGSNAANAISVFIDGSNVYVTGFENVNGIYTAKLWKNGIVEDLPSSGVAGSGNSVFVHGTDVYVAGQDFENGLLVAKLWINGVPTNLGAGYGLSVFVK